MRERQLRDKIIDCPPESRYYRDRESETRNSSVAWPMNAKYFLTRKWLILPVQFLPFLTSASTSRTFVINQCIIIIVLQRNGDISSTKLLYNYDSISFSFQLTLSGSIFAKLVGGDL